MKNYFIISIITLLSIILNNIFNIENILIRILICSLSIIIIISIYFIIKEIIYKKENKD